MTEQDGNGEQLQAYEPSRMSQLLQDSEDDGEVHTASGSKQSRTPTGYSLARAEPSGSVTKETPEQQTIRMVMKAVGDTVSSHVRGKLKQHLTKFTRACYNVIEHNNKVKQLKSEVDAINDGNWPARCNPFKAKFEGDELLESNVPEALSTQLQGIAVSGTFSRGTARTL